MARCASYAPTQHTTLNSLIAWPDVLVRWHNEDEGIYYVLSLGIRVGRWTCRYGRLALMPLRIVISRKSVRIPKWSLHRLESCSTRKRGQAFRKSRQYESNSVFKLGTHALVSLFDGIINASNGWQRTDIRGQIQDTYKLAKLWRQLWTYITSGFRLSKVLGADVCCTKINDSGSYGLITAVNISRINEY